MLLSFEKKELKIHGVLPYLQELFFPPPVHLPEQQSLSVSQTSNLIPQLEAGALVGAKTGALVGAKTGALVGAAVGVEVGADGAEIGAEVGADGAEIGAEVGSETSSDGPVISPVYSIRLGEPSPGFLTKPDVASKRILSAISAGVREGSFWRSKAATPAT